MRPLQVTVGSPDGIDIHALIAAIRAAYRPDGAVVDVRVGTGADGLPAGMIYVEERPC